ncbi:MAG: Stp1/IreP family PP2C-type Ser/Thr phosphatase [Thermoanaerobaculia bacterium]|nr:Stp1/IreP family PP2C-type Ser/Thr phosphatase [Thermoanaerobaculia bacterium]
MTEQIEPTPAEPTSGALVVRVAQLSDVGRVRSENQDYSILSAPADEVDRNKGRLMVVADGMGGHRGGATASRMAATITKDEYYRDSDTDVVASLTRALERANARIFAESQINPELRGMGTTCSALVVRGREGYFAHVGDSRIYLVRDEAISQLTDDHSLVASMVREGLLTTQEAEVHPRRNVLQRSMGVGQAVEIDASKPFEVRPGDTFVLCSDGLHGLVKSDEILTISKVGIEDAARELVRLALERGAPDNVTVVVARAEEASAEEIAAWEIAAREERAKSMDGQQLTTEEVDMRDAGEITTQRMIAVSDDDFDYNDAPTERIPVLHDDEAPDATPQAAGERPQVVDAAPRMEEAKTLVADATPPEAAPPAPKPVVVEEKGGNGWVIGIALIVAIAVAVAYLLFSAK